MQIMFLLALRSPAQVLASLIYDHFPFRMRFHCTAFGWR